MRAASDPRWNRWVLRGRVSARHPLSADTLEELITLAREVGLVPSRSSDVVAWAEQERRER